MQLFLSPSHATLLRKFERNVTRQTQLCRRHQTVSPIGIKQGLSMGRGLGDLWPPPPVFCPKKSKHASKKVENKNSSPRALKQNVYSISKYVIPDKLQFTIEPPKTTNSLQQSLFLAESPYIDSNLNLSAMATFFCPQGGHCGEVQLYIHFPSPCYYFYSLR